MLGKFVPGLAKIDYVYAIGTSLPFVWVHVHLKILGAQMALGRQKHLNILRSRIENGGKVRRRHLCC